MTQRWHDVRPRVVTDEQRVAEARQEMEAEATRSTRWFWWHASSLAHRWHPLYWGTDENCNPTIGLRVPGGVIFLCRGWRVRQDECEECRSLR